MNAPLTAPLAPDTGAARTGDGGGGDAAADRARRALRWVASGVTVLTVEADGLTHGTTVSAVVAVSREPLILAACLRTSSAFSGLAARAGRFAVNVLTAAQHSVASRFATPGRPAGTAQFAGLGWEPDPHTGAPLIRDCLAHLSCRLLASTPVGDHDVVFAEVMDGSAGNGSPLLTYAGRLQLAPAPPERS